ncbi:MAG: hypothetical protein ACP5GS_08570 [Nitrososphaeria archaeon]
MKLQKDGRLYELEEDEKEWRLKRLPASKIHIIIVLFFLALGIWMIQSALITLGAVWALYVWVFPKRSYSFSKSSTKMTEDTKHVIFLVGNKKVKFTKIK